VTTTLELQESAQGGGGVVGGWMNQLLESMSAQIEGEVGGVSQVPAPPDLLLQLHAAEKNSEEKIYNIHGGRRGVGAGPPSEEEEAAQIHGACRQAEQYLEISVSGHQNICFFWVHYFQQLIL